MTINVTSEQDNDCVIVALANYFAMSYDDTLREINANPYSWKFENKGVPSTIYKWFMNKRQARSLPVPRRGQYFMNGIIVMKSASGVKRHMLIIADGMAFDNAHPKGLPIAWYRKSTSMRHIDEYYKFEGM